MIAKEQRMNTMGGRAAVVTGSSSGIGQAVAIAFAQRGASVTVVANNNLEGGQDTVRQIEEAGGEAILVQVDIAREDGAEMLVERTVQAFGRLDYACNNAGFDGAFSTVADFSSEEYRKVIGVNLDGVFFGMKHQSRWMLGHGGGAIVNVSSILGTFGDKLKAPYCAAKHGVHGITKSAAIDYARSNIRVNALAPGAILTPMFAAIMKEQPEQADLAITAIPMGRMGRPEEIAKTVVWLCSDEASYITGQVIGVDGGLSSAL
jgi:NAD(P)-dependent dehydrogenase (short-subunit alcohol dehydrogenase family)